MGVRRPVPLDAGRFYATTPKFVRPLAAMNELYSMCRYWFGVNLVSISESYEIRRPHPLPPARC